MHRIVVVLFMSLFFLAPLRAQELNCTVSINAAQVTSTNKQVFQTLEKSLTEFINNRQWTNKVYKLQERIDCGMTIIINTQESTNFTGTLQVNAVRPVYGTSYKTPIFNHKDNDISFQYVEFEPLNYNETNFETNLVSIISYYIYIILGVDADTFALKGGEPYFNKALDISSLAQQGQSTGWEQERNKLNRFSLIDQILAPAHAEYRQALYSYHREGMDVFSSRKEEGKQNIFDAILLFDQLWSHNRNSFLIRTFFDAKSDEIVEIFQEKDKISTDGLSRILSKLSPVNSVKWEIIN